MPLSLFVFLAVWFGCTMVLTVGFTVAGQLFGESWDWWLAEVTADIHGPTGFLFNNLFLFTLVPSAVLSTSIGQRIGIGFTHSVAGRWRWGWFGQVNLILLPLWVLYAVGSSLVHPVGELTPHARVVTMLVIVWLTTPLQCAGEEYAFRGWFLQNIGGLFASRIAAWVVPTMLSTGLFALAHGSLDPWILIDLALFAIGLSVMTWRTGGLEAAVALHTLNNMIVMHFGVIAGGFEESIINPTTTGSPAAVAVSLVAQSAAIALVWWWAKRREIEQYTSAPTRPGHRLRPPVPGRLHGRPETTWQPMAVLPMRPIGAEGDQSGPGRSDDPERFTR